MSESIETRFGADGKAWHPVYNAGSTPIPPFGVMRSAGLDEDHVYLVEQPDGDSLTEVFVNGETTIIPGDYGEGTRTEPLTALIETADGDPAEGDDYGTQSGSWKLHAGKKGFRVIGWPSGGNTAQLTFLGVSFKELDEAGGRRPVRAATTANITLSGTQTIDGVSIAVGEDVLVKDQSTTANNGIYTAASSTWARRADADSWDELVGALVVVTEGTTLADTLWMCTSNAGGTLGSTAVSWSRIASASGLYSIDVREADGSPAYGFVSELQFDGTTATGPFELSEPSGGKALVSLKDAADGQRGVVTSGAQTFRGPKSFIERTNFYLDTDNYQIELWAGALNLGSIRSTGTSTNGETRVRTSLNNDDGYNMFYTAWLNSGAPQFMLSLDGFGPGITPAFVIRDSDSNEFIGQTTTVSGLVFKGGIYTSGSLSVTVSAGDVTGLDEAIDDRVAALLVAGAGIGLSYNDGAGTLTISCTITQYTDEMARDAIGTALTAGTGIGITVNDGADTITVALSFLGLEALTDPGADRILFWDDSAGAFTWLTLGSGLSISTTTLTATGSITGPGSSTDNAIVRWDGTGGTAIQNSTALIADDGSMDVNSTIAATGSTDEILHLHQACSGGTPTAGFGTVIQVHLANDGSSDVKAMTWTTTWVDATHASRKSRVIWHINDTASREIMRGEASGSAPMVGFLGANAAIRQTGDVGTAMVTFGLMSGTPTFAWGNLSSVPTASDTASGIVELAVQSEMETATDTSRAVVPGRVQYHPGVCKGWVHFSATGGTVTSLASHNVSSITDGGVGNYTINWNTDFSGADYAVVGTASYLDGTATDVIVETHISFAAGSAQVYTLSYDAGTLVDTTRISIVAFGDQA